MKEITLKLLKVIKQTSSKTNNNSTKKFSLLHHTTFIISMALKMVKADY